MGCARWRGARLRDILDKVGVKKEAIEIVLDGAEGPVVDKTPAFVKCIPVWKAMEETTIVAYEMNGQQLPHFNGFTARVIVPGWTGTYWMKHVTSIDAVTKPFTGFWMNSAYRIPLRAFPLVERFVSQDSAVSTPITEMVVNSLITSHANGASVKAGAPVTVGGIAWDGGYGIRTVLGASPVIKTYSLAWASPPIVVKICSCWHRRWDSSSVGCAGCVGEDRSLSDPDKVILGGEHINQPIRPEKTLRTWSRASRGRGARRNTTASDFARG